MKSQLELLEIQDQEAVKNTYYRYPKVTPHITKYDSYVEIKTIDDKAELHKIDEVVLYIKAEWPKEHNHENYAFEIDYIKVQIDSTQVD